MSIEHDQHTTRLRAIASVIGGIGGAAYVVINASPLGEPTAAALRILAVAALLWILARAWRWRTASPQARASRAGFGAGYWTVVALEVALILGGAALIVGPLDEPGDVVPWLSLVVGLHFFAFVEIFHKMTYLWLGLLISASAIVAFVLVGSGATPAAVAVSAGILPGVVLLAFGVIRVPGVATPVSTRAAHTATGDAGHGAGRLLQNPGGGVRDARPGWPSRRPGHHGDRDRGRPGVVGIRHRGRRRGRHFPRDPRARRRVRPVGRRRLPPGSEAC